jgi:mycoredoxin
MDQGIVMYSTTWCGDCRRAKRVLDQLDVDYREVNVDADEAAAEYVVQVNSGNRSVPTIVFPDGDILVEPSNASLTQKLVDMGLVAA